MPCPDDRQSRAPLRGGCEQTDYRKGAVVANAEAPPLLAQRHLRVARRRRPRLVGVFDVEVAGRAPQGRRFTRRTGGARGRKGGAASRQAAVGGRRRGEREQPQRAARAPASPRPPSSLTGRRARARRPQHSSARGRRAPPHVDESASSSGRGLRRHFGRRARRRISQQLARLFE